LTLGNYVEISTTVEGNHEGNGEHALEFYQKLGFQHAGYRVMTDGSINLNLAPAGVPAPMLRYAGSNIESVAALGIEVQDYGRGIGLFRTPEGLHIMLSPFDSRVPMPEGTPMERTPLSRCGKFGEYALPVQDHQAAVAFWEKLGFSTLHTASEPYPFSILSDNLIIIGLHQTSDFDEPHLTYFAPDMAERIQALQADGIQMEPVMPEAGDRIVNASITGMGGEKFFLFQGEI
jgi:hypothetical protein